MTDDELAMQEFIRGMEMFEAQRQPTKEIINKILYNRYTGTIVAKIIVPKENNDPDLILMDVDQTYIHDEKLLTDFHVVEGQIEKKPQHKIDYTRMLLELNHDGRFITAKNNMLFIDNQGDTYDYKN